MKISKPSLTGLDFQKQFINLNFLLIYASAIVGMSYLFFNYLYEIGLNYLFIAFLVLGMGIAGVLWTFIFKKVQNPFLFVILDIPVGICAFALVFIKTIWSAIIGFILVGFLGLTITMGFIIYLKKVTRIETRGREIGKLLTLYGILVLAISIMAFFVHIDILFIMFGIMLITYGIIGLLLYKSYTVPEPEKSELILTHDLQRKDFYYYFIAIFMFLLVLGICVWLNLEDGTTTQFAEDAGAIFFGGYSDTPTGLENSLFYMSLPMPLAAYPVGVLIDRIGRREMFLIGLVSNSVGLFFLAFFYSMETLILAWFFIGIGMVALLNLTITIIIDVRDELSRKYLGICWSFFFSGLIVGVLVGFVTVDQGFSHVSQLILMAFPVAIFAVLHAQDTLPSKEEREWRSCVQNLFLMFGSINIVHYPFHGKKAIDEDLFAGGISGMSALIQELTSSDEQIEVFSQKNTKIILKYGKYLTGALISSKDLNILHHKLQGVIDDYEDIFVDYFEDWDGELLKFNPGIRLIKRHFF